MLKLLSAPTTIGRPIFTSPGVPEERVKALRAAFDATMKDPDFLADAKKRNFDINPVSRRGDAEDRDRHRRDAEGRSPTGCSRSSRRSEAARQDADKASRRARVSSTSLWVSSPAGSARPSAAA